MRTKSILTRTALPLLIGVGLVAVALWLFGAMPVRGAINSAPIDKPEVTTASESPVQAQAPITIPFGQAPVTVDGNCREYTDGVLYTFSELPGTTGRVYLKHDNSNLFVCLEGVPGERADRFASVYLDTNNGREPIAQSDDKSLRVNITDGITKSLQGSGVPNGYVPATLPGWMAGRDPRHSDRQERLGGSPLYRSCYDA